MSTTTETYKMSRFEKLAVVGLVVLVSTLGVAAGANAKANEVHSETVVTTSK